MGDSHTQSSSNGPDSRMRRNTATSSVPSSGITSSSSAALPPQRRTVKREKSGNPKNMNGPLYMQRNENIVLVRRVKRKGEGPLKQLTRWFVENQIGFAFNLLALLFLAHGCMPRARSHTGKYFTLSYYNPTTGQYGLGKDDGFLIFFCIILFTGLRAATLEYLFAPYAKSKGISKRKDITRFSEQAWLLIYYSVFWTLGLYIYWQSPHFFNLRELWTNWPNRELTGIMKGYMLAQLAFWLQQILVINIEERRKDHWQMFTHHIITICLIYASYRYGHTRVGNLILVLMDVVDLFLPLAKCLKYLGHSSACDFMFVVFMISWFVARHVLYLTVCYSVYTHTTSIIPYGCFSGAPGNLKGPFQPPADKGALYLLEPLWNPDGLVCYDDTVKWIFLSMLLFLQALTIMWFSLIIRVALRVLRGEGADDTRSDDEGCEDVDAEDDEDETEFVYEEAQALAEEVGVDELDLKNWAERRRAGNGVGGVTATGVSLPGHSDRKELLGRIGCEKQVE
ncbi:longevity assurance proteins LAG1/LAC1 [Neurospora tetrasperma FGSC 2509]|nr:longevity assurance proteins LAG1/LAC1 [Neurospora tetrasperma FGSC 2509]